MRQLDFQYDLFFLSLAFYDQYQSHLGNQLLVPREEFIQHTSYNQIEQVNLYRMWRLSYDMVLVAPPGWYEEQEASFQEALRSEIFANGHSLHWKGQILTSQLWNRFSKQEQHAYLTSRDDQLNLETIDHIVGYDYLKKWHGVFPSQQGGNCFASVLYALAKEEFFLHQWVHEQTFLHFLARQGYAPVNKSMVQSGDILCFYQGEQLVHASYMVDGISCFNKYGQTFWEPWEILPWRMVWAEFPETRYTIWRNK